MTINNCYSSLVGHIVFLINFVEFLKLTYFEKKNTFDEK